MASQIFLDLLSVVSVITLLSSAVQPYNFLSVLYDTATAWNKLDVGPIPTNDQSFDHYFGQPLVRSSFTTSHYSSRQFGNSLLSFFPLSILILALATIKATNNAGHQYCAASLIFIYLPIWSKNIPHLNQISNATADSS